MQNVICIVLQPNIIYIYTNTHTLDTSTPHFLGAKWIKLISFVPFSSQHSSLAAHLLCGPLIWSRAVLSGIRRARPLCAQQGFKLCFNLLLFLLFRRYIFFFPFLQLNCKRIIKAVKTTVFTIACEPKAERGV